MSTIVCIDTVDWLGAGVVSIGDTGFGVLGSSIPSTGDAGAGYAYNDLELPADASKEICGRITTWPAIGTLYAYEDTSFTYSRPSDGSDSFQYQLYVDGIEVGTPQTVTLTVGAAAGNAPGATLTGTSTIAGGAATGGAAGSASGAVLAGAATIEGGAATGGISASAPGANLTGTATITGGAASGEAAGFAPGATLTGLSSITGGSASSNQFARAPSGDGYRPRTQAKQSRPADLQGYRR